MKDRVLALVVATAMVLGCVQFVAQAWRWASWHALGFLVMVAFAFMSICLAILMVVFAAHPENFNQ